MYFLLVSTLPFLVSISTPPSPLHFLRPITILAPPSLYRPHADVEPPTLVNCPSNLVGSTSPGEATAMVFWPSPSASDNSMATVAVASNFQPNDAFPIGVAIVVYTATDPSGNSANCSFEVRAMGRFSRDADDPRDVLLQICAVFPMSCLFRGLPPATL